MSNIITVKLGIGCDPALPGLTNAMQTLKSLGLSTEQKIEIDLFVNFAIVYSTAIACLECGEHPIVRGVPIIIRDDLPIDWGIEYKTNDTIYYVGYPEL